MPWVFSKGLLAVFPPLCPAHVLSVSSACQTMMVQKPRFDLSDSVWWQASKPTRTFTFTPRSFSQVVGGNPSGSFCLSPSAQMDTRQKLRVWRPGAKKSCAWFTLILTLSVRTHASFFTYWENNELLNKSCFSVTWFSLPLVRFPNLLYSQWFRLPID